MTLIALFADERGWLASGRRVYAPDEVDALDDAIEMTAALSARLAAREREDREAREAGFAAGREEGCAAALAEGRARTADALLSLERAAAAERRRLRETAASLALEIVRGIAADVAPGDWLAAQARAAAEDLVDERGATLRVRPERVADVAARLAARDESGLRVVGDDALADGGCRLETAAGHVDVDLETQLARLAERLADVDGTGATDDGATAVPDDGTTGGARASGAGEASAGDIG